MHWCASVHIEQSDYLKFLLNIKIGIGQDKQDIFCYPYQLQKKFTSCIPN